MVMLIGRTGMNGGSTARAGMIATTATGMDMMAIAAKQGP
jgi:hypothetical protein